MRLVFAGTPEVACVSLDRLLTSRHTVVAVLTRPDARSGRGRALSPSPVAARADELGIPVLRPESLKDPVVHEALTSLAPDCCPVVAYGGLVPPSLLDLPKHGWVNLHFSLLPSWRGAAPVQHAVLHGDDVTGATTFLLTEGLDTGPVFGSVTEGIGANDTSGELLDRLAHTGAELLVRTLDGIEDGELRPVDQPTDGISVAPKLTSGDARVRWSDPALAVDRRIRACTPNPGAWTVRAGERLGVMGVASGSAGPPRTEEEGLDPGVVRVTKRAVHVGTGSVPIELDRVRPAGGKVMAAADWARGARVVDGERFE
ncbi:MAG TPA: methionyl-tRNA formyltransferase [Actinomycetes bacterium]|nr:methionyl-tRNA formyltransferase [Actinomycetes bacterium]